MLFSQLAVTSAADVDEFCVTPRSVSSDSCIRLSADASSLQVYISTAALPSTFETRILGLVLFVILSVVSPELLALSRLEITGKSCSYVFEL